MRLLKTLLILLALAMGLMMFGLVASTGSRQSELDREIKRSSDLTDKIAGDVKARHRR